MTKTEVANRALSILTSGTITDIADELDEKARIIDAIFNIAAREVMREHRWNCCIKRATLTQTDPSPEKEGYFGYSFSYTLPTDCLRFLDLNGEPYSPKSEFMDLNGRELHTNAAEARIRYVADMTADADVLVWDVSLAAAVSVKIAMLVGRRITKDGMSYEDLYQLYQRELDTARKLDAMEVGSGENRPLNRIIERSPLIDRGRRFGMSGAYSGGSGGSSVNPPVDLDNYYTKIECDSRFALITTLDQKADQSSVSNVDNTSDADKPVSTAQQAALDLKADQADVDLIIPAPTGSILHFAAASAPTGWLKADGAEVSRTTYANLYAVIGDTYGAGDGTTTFNLPDLRGEFVRGWDDSRGIDTGRGFGSSQDDAFQGHAHNIVSAEDLNRFEKVRMGAAAIGGYALGTPSDSTDNRHYSDSPIDNVTVAAHHLEGADGEGTPRTASETRPRNVALLAIIKY